MSQMEISSVGARIRVIQGKMGVGEFAEALGVNRKTVTRWVADDSLPDGASLLAILDKFGVDPSWVLTGRGAGLQLNAEEQMLLTRYRNSPASLQDAALRVLLGGGEATASRYSFNKMAETVQEQVVGDVVYRESVTFNSDRKNKR